jgi:hypothetical protein
MSFTRDGRFLDREARYQDNPWARQKVPSSQDYQAIDTPVSPIKCNSATTFGASARAVLLSTNHTAQGKIAGFAMHRSENSLSPRPGPGSHTTSLTDARSTSLWKGTQSPVSLEVGRLKAKVNFLNFRMTGEFKFESMAPILLQERKKNLCLALKALKDASDQTQTSCIRESLALTHKSKTRKNSSA